MAKFLNSEKLYKQNKFFVHRIRNLTEVNIKSLFNSVWFYFCGLFFLVGLRRAKEVYHGHFLCSPVVRSFAEPLQKFITPSANLQKNFYQRRARGSFRQHNYRNNRLFHTLNSLNYSPTNLTSHHSSQECFLIDKLILD